jgi:predicted Mrr-cat superfamily restriction endonuclease
MNIEVIKYELINKMLSTTDENLLEQLVAVFKKSTKNNDGISVVQYNNELNAAEVRMNGGKFTTHEDLELESNEW